jgi:aspartyl/glutamyl-tRNA(Asn/Gln) amidotransferase C subunit
MNFTEQDLDTLSTLARIDIDTTEKQKTLHDVQSILQYVSEINDVQGDLEKGEEVLFNVVRDDVVTREAGEMTDVILANAPATKDGYVEVMQVLK